MDYSVATYNVHGCRGARGFAPERVAEVLAELDADVVGLQEVGDVYGLSPPDVDQAAELARLTGMRLVHAPTMSRGALRYGNAILTRLPVLGSRAYDLSVEGREPRGCVRADLDLGGGAQLHVFNLHLGLSRKERHRQAAKLLSDDILRDATLASPAVVMGDFNFWLPGPVPRLLRHALLDVGETLSRTHPTYPATWPLLRLDRIYLGPGLLPREVRVHRTPRAALASDHLPLRAAVELAHPTSPGDPAPISP